MDGVLQALQRIARTVHAEDNFRSLDKLMVSGPVRSQGGRNLRMHHVPGSLGKARAQKLQVERSYSLHSICFHDVVLSEPCLPKRTASRAEALRK